MPRGFQGFDDDEIMEAQLAALQQQLATQSAAITQLTQQLETEKQKKVELPANLLTMLCGNSTPPPKPFTFQASDWSEWITRFEQYRTTTPLQHMGEEQQVNKMLYFMGGKANDILATFKLTEEDKKVYLKVKERFDSHYIAKKTKMYMRGRFNIREQKEGESVDQYITELHTLGKKCEYGAMTDELVRDRLIVGISNKTLSLQLQNMEKELTLEEVIDRVRHAEVVLEHQRFLQPQSKIQDISQVQSANKNNNNNTNSDVNNNSKGKKKKNFKKNQEKKDEECNPKTTNLTTNPQQPRQKPCGWCGHKDRHNREVCPAKNSNCGHCNVLGHWSAVCHIKKKEMQQQRGIHSVENNNPQNPPTNPQNPSGAIGSFFFSSVDIESTTKEEAVPAVPPIIRNITLQGINLIAFKCDTGADATVMGPEHYQNCTGLPDIKPLETTLRGPDSSILQAHGVVRQVRMSYKNTTRFADIYIVKGVKTPLLGRAESIALGFIIINPECNEVAKTQLEIVTNFPSVFQGLGKIPGAYQIKTVPDARPIAVTATRHISIPLRKPVEAELQSQVERGIIEKVEHPTQWCSHMCPVIKKRPNEQGEFAPGSIRITVDYAALNQVIIRELFQLPTVEECFAMLAGCNIFSKLDANQSYHQVEISEDSRDLTTFLTHVGRFRYKRLPMGLKSSSEVFQRRMQDIIGGMPGVVNLMDDCLVGGRNQQEHDMRLKELLTKFKNNNVTLNPEKCKISVKACTMLGHHISAAGISPLISKTEAILKMPQPKDITALRSFLGSINHLMKFLPNLIEVDQPLRDLLKNDSELVWKEEHTKAFNATKELLIRPPVLAWYDPKLQTRVTADSSMYGMGAVLEQFSPTAQDWKPVHFISLTFTETQLRYSMIEKEACAVTVACERFKMYLIGLPQFTIRTDHKPLVSILQTKQLSELSVRLQRFRMRLTPYWYVVEHIPGKFNYIADALSRCPLPATQEDSDILEDHIDNVETTDEMVIHSTINQLPMGTPLLQKIAEAQAADKVCKEIREYLRTEWPDRKQLSEKVLPFSEHRADLSLIGDVLTFQNRIYIPPTMRQEALARVHEGHFPLQKIFARARQAVWWPKIKADLIKMTETCSTCIQHKTQRPEPLLQPRLPEYPWDIIGADVGTYQSTDYLIVMDAYSKYPLYFQLTSMSAKVTIDRLKALFSLFGCPRILRTDRGTNFDSAEFRKFQEEYDFEHHMSSSEHHQSNGLAEAAVKIIKTIMDKNPSDPTKALMEYRATPNDSGYSPSQLFLCRQIKTTLPTIQDLHPELPSRKKYRIFMEQKRNRMKTNYDARHKVKPLQPLRPNDKVWIPDMKEYGTVIKPASGPRQYLVQNQRGYQIVRNRRYLVLANNQKESTSSKEGTTPEENPNTQESNKTEENNKTQENKTTRPTRIRKQTEKAKASDLKCYAKA